MLSYKNSSVEYSDIEKLRSKISIYSTGNEEDEVLEVCGEVEVVYLFHPKGVDDKSFYFYLGFLDDFQIQILFTDLEAGLLTTMNIASVQF